MANYVFEFYKSIYDFEESLNRKENSVFEKEPSLSSKEENSWSGTNTWDEANKLLHNGWQSGVTEMVKNLENYKKEIEYKTITMERSVVGFAPCVPAAIVGHPISMYRNREETQSRKMNAVHIMYVMGASSATSKDFILECGLTVLKTVVWLESKGIRVKLDICPKAVASSSYGNAQLAAVLVNVKDYMSPLNLMKMAYPMAHTAFFRRHGFRWLETCPQITDGDFRNGYGTSFRYLDGKTRHDFWKAQNIDTQKMIYLDTQIVGDAHGDPEKLLKRVGGNLHF